MADFTSPQNPEGKNYWDDLYKKAEELFGRSDMTIPTLTRPWIVPGEILIRQTKENAYIYKATLKVMLEQDYLKGVPEYKFDDPRLKTLNEYSSQLIRPWPKGWACCAPCRRVDPVQFAEARCAST